MKSNLSIKKPQLKLRKKKLKARPEWSLYVVRCADGTFYTGIAKDVTRRIAAHNSGKGAKYTSARKPVALLFQEPVGDYSAALKREYQVKHLTRKGKEEFISGKPLRRPRKTAKMTFMKPRKKKKPRKVGGLRRKTLVMKIKKGFDLAGFHSLKLQRIQDDPKVL